MIMDNPIRTRKRFKANMNPRFPPGTTSGDQIHRLPLTFRGGRKTR